MAFVNAHQARKSALPQTPPNLCTDLIAAMRDLPVLWGSALLCVTLVLAAGVPEEVQEQEVQAFSTWAEIQAREHRAEATSQLMVKNSASSAVRLANCIESHTVPAGGSVSLKLQGLAVFWVLPQDKSWDCHAGPFDLFYIDANLTGPRPAVGLGFGLVFNQSEMIERPPRDVEPPTQSTGSGNGGNEDEAEEEQQQQEAEEDGEGGDGPGEIFLEVAGLELTAGGAEVAAKHGEGGLVARCGEGVCGEGHEVEEMPEGLTLAIMGPQERGWGRGRGRWGYGRYGWRRGGWRRWGWRR